jgi:MFS family permease
MSNSENAVRVQLECYETDVSIGTITVDAEQDFPMNVTIPTSYNKSGKWMALAAALLGWTFDGFEIGMFSLVGPSALDDLLGREAVSNPMLKNEWFGAIMSVFLVGAATGGVAFGWLGDRIGRVRAMSLSILTYAIFTGLGGFASHAWHLAILRFIASLGMGGEWALGVALVTELWPDRSRALLAGLIGASANIGLLMVGLLSLVLVGFIHSVGEALLSIGLSESTTSFLVRGEGWRLVMIAGALPALIIFFIRLCVPESHKWEAQRNQGATSLWSTHDVLGVVIGALVAMVVIVVWTPLFSNFVTQRSSLSVELPEITNRVNALRLGITLVGLPAILMGYMFPVQQYLSRAERAGHLVRGDQRRYIGRMILAACLAGVPLLGTWGSLQWAPKWAIALAQQLPDGHRQSFAKEHTLIAMASGAVLGTIIAALIADWLGRRITYAFLCAGSFVSMIYLYQANDAYGTKLLASSFAAGGITAAVYGLFPLYFPELFPTCIRATAQGFAFNFGRVLSAIGALQTASLIAIFAQGIAVDEIETKAFPMAGATLATIYLIGVCIIWLGPETKGRPLPN